MSGYVLRPRRLGAPAEVEVVKIEDGAEQVVGIGTLIVDWPPHGDHVKDETRLECGVRFVGYRASS